MPTLTLMWGYGLANNMENLNHQVNTKLKGLPGQGENNYNFPH